MQPATGIWLAEPLNGRKHAEKHERREQKVREHADRPPEPWDRFRILIEAISEGRQVIDLTDHRARYALVVLGVLNAGAFAFISRAHLLGGLPRPAKLWAVGLLLFYGLLNLVFILHAIDCLRPRSLSHAVPPEGPLREGRPMPVHRPLGIMFWESVAKMDLVTYHRAWDHAVMGQVNAEAEAVFHTMARVIQAKYRALHRLYAGLAGLVILAFCLLCLFTVLTVRA
jgi:hypothetical protein